MPIMVFWCSFVHNFMFPFLTRTRETLHICLDLGAPEWISAPDSESGPAQPSPAQPSPARAQLYPVIISISCADQTDRDVSPAVITDRVQNNANFLIPFATLKIHCTFAKVLSAYCISIPKASLFEKYFHFCLQIFLQARNIKTCKWFGNNIT